MGKYKGAKAWENKHPVVQRSLALVMRTPSGSDGVIGFCAKTLVSVSGKAVPESRAHNHLERQNSKLQEVADAAAIAPAKPTPIPQDEVVKAATSKSDSLH